MTAPPLRPFDAHRAIVRIAISLAGGLAAFAAVGWRFRPEGSMLVGWNVAGLVLLALSWSGIVSANAETTKQRAGSEDPGRTVVYAIVVMTSAVSLLGATVLVRNPHALSPELAGAHAALCLATVALAWTMTHTAFTFRYAHLCYREDDEGVGGIDVPGKLAPAYFDFAYFAFTIGMCFQVSDVTVTSPQIRHTVLLHAVISFAYNSIVLAFVLNLVFGSAG